MCNNASAICMPGLIHCAAIYLSKLPVLPLLFERTSSAPCLRSQRRIRCMSMAMSIRFPESSLSDCSLSRLADITFSSDFAMPQGSTLRQMLEIHSPHGDSRWPLASMHEAVVHLRTAAVYPNIEAPSAAAPIMMA